MELTPCHCVRFNTGSLIDRWNIRAFPVLRRALVRGVRINPQRLGSVVAAITKIGRGEVGDVNGAHHLKTCPCHPAQRATVPLKLLRTTVAPSRP